MRPATRWSSAFIPLARHLARRYGRDHAHAEDVLQVASIGLLKAIDRYDPDRGIAFTSFATPTILGEIKRYFRDKSWAVRVPRELQELSMKVGRATEELESNLGRPPTAAELAGRLGASIEDVLEARVAATARYGVSLDRPSAATRTARPRSATASPSTTASSPASRTTRPSSA